MKKRWLIEFAIASQTAIVRVAKVLLYTHFDNSWSAEIRNLKTDPGTPEPLLSVSIILNADNSKDAEEAAEENLGNFLNWICFVTNSPISYHQMRRIIDWTPGIKERECIVGHSFCNPDVPYFAVNQEMIETIARYFAYPADDELSLALRWYRRAVNSNLVDEAFQYFWFALETLAQRLKPVNKVPDLCSKCRKPLFCEACNEISKHRPYPKQLIEELIKKTITGKAEAFYIASEKVRHALMHGEPIKKVESEHKINLSKLNDALGQAVWTMLINEIKAKLPQKEGGHKFVGLKPTTYTNFHMRLHANFVITAPESADINNPQLEDFPNLPANVSLIVHERETGGKTEHAPNP